jgi:hypothetical protein
LSREARSWRNHCGARCTTAWMMAEIYASMAWLYAAAPANCNRAARHPGEQRRIVCRNPATPQTSVARITRTITSSCPNLSHSAVADPQTCRRMRPCCCCAP